MLILKPRFWMLLGIITDSVISGLNVQAIKQNNTSRRSNRASAIYQMISSIFDFAPYATQIRNYPNHVKTRDSRNADDKTQFVNHTTAVAHIVNGIYLQSGIMAKKIPIDELVGEILNFGSVKVADISNYKSDQVTALSSKLRSMEPFTPDLVKFENQALDWNTWWVNSKVIENGEFKKVPGMDGYFTDIAALPSKFQTSRFDDLRKAKGDIDKQIGSIEGSLGKPLQKGVGTTLTGNFQQLSDALETYTNELTLMEKEAKILDSYESLRKGSATFEKVEKLIIVISFRNNLNILGLDPKLKTLKQQMQKVLELVADAKSSAVDTTTIKELVKHRTFPESQSIKHTKGLPNGISDLKQLVKDVRNPWLGTILGLDAPKMNRLADSLQPLFKINEPLSGMDDKLKPISSPNIYQSLLKFSEIQTDLAVLSTDLADQVNILKKFDECSGVYGPGIPDTYLDSQKVIANVRLLEKYIRTITSSMKTLDVTEFKKDVKTFIDTLGFTKLSDAASSLKEINSVMENLKNGEKIAKFKQRLLEATKLFDSVKSTELKANLNELAKGKATIEDIKFQRAVDGEIEIYNCVKKFADKAAKVSRVIQTIQTLRNLDKTSLDDVDKVASSVSTLSKDLSETKSIPENMKNNAKEVTVEVNKVPDLEKTAESIGQSIRSLQDAYELKELETSVSNLKKVQTSVESQIHKISDPEKRKVAENQWGDHKKDVTELEDSISNIKSFDTKLDVSKAKTMGEYSNPLKDLVTLSDAKINAKDKLIVLETIVSSTTDPKIKSDLGEAKKTLETISSLDLQFSSHSNQFQSAPAAFKTFHDFLLTFLTRPDIQTTNSSEENNGASSTTLYICIGVGIGVLVIAVIVVLILRFRPKEKNNRKQWVSNLANPVLESHLVKYAIRIVKTAIESSVSKIKCLNGVIIAAFDIPNETREEFANLVKNIVDNGYKNVVGLPKDILKKIVGTDFDGYAFKDLLEKERDGIKYIECTARKPGSSETIQICFYDFPKFEFTTVSQDNVLKLIKVFLANKLNTLVFRVPGSIEHNIFVAYYFCYVSIGIQKIGLENLLILLKQKGFPIEDVKSIHFVELGVIKLVVMDGLVAEKEFTDRVRLVSIEEERIEAEKKAAGANNARPPGGLDIVNIAEDHVGVIDET